MKVTKPMLAGKVDEAKLRFPLLASPKLDGIRCLVEDGMALTRSFKPVPNAYVTKLLETLATDGVLDGELTLQNPAGKFGEVSSAIMREDGEPDFRFNTFDHVGWEEGALLVPFEDRLKRLKKWAARQPGYINVVPHELLVSRAQLDVYESVCLGLGYEGVMVRDPKGPYKCGRSSTREGYLLKLKRFIDGEAVVLRFEERMHNENVATRDELGRTKRSSAKAGLVGAGTLGALVVKDVATGVEFGIGTGFDDRLRKELWHRRDGLVGAVVKYKSQPVGAKDAPRFPVFLGFRDARDL